MLSILQILKPFNQETKSGLIIFDKPAGITTNDLVYQVRKEYGTRKVGAAGVLDPFATGAVIIGIGSCTKDLTQFENSEKEYEFEMIFGLQTLSGDNQDIVTKILPFRKVSNENETKGLKTNEDLDNLISNFPKSYFQEVPLLSSVKVQGHKLRELTRKNTGNIEFLNEYIFDSEVEREVNFKNSGLTLKVPRRKVEIKSLELLESGIRTYEEVIQNASQDFVNSLSVSLNYSFHWESGFERNHEMISEKTKGVSFQFLKLKSIVSKGTYIRKLAEDIAYMNNDLGCVISLRRMGYS